MTAVPAKAGAGLFNAGISVVWFAVDENEMETNEKFP